MFAAFAVIFLLCANQNDASVKWKSNMKSFSHSIKQDLCHKDMEKVIFEYDTGPGVVTEQWFTGATCFNEDTRILYYIDGEEKPSIDMNLYLGHGIGFVKKQKDRPGLKDNPERFAPWFTKKEEPGLPWGSRRIGHLASGGGLYNTYRVPFKKSIKISFISKSNGAYWFIIRGVENFPIIIGDIELPVSAQLKLYKLEKVVMKPFQFVSLASTDKKAGMLYQITLAINGSFSALEACFRAVIDDSHKIQYLSSGTEDMFMSAYYYDQGIYHTNQAGLTFFEFPHAMSAYKFFEDDPVLFTKSFKLIWRCGELVDNECFLAKRRGCHTKNKRAYCKSKEDNDEFDKAINRLNKNLKDTVVSAYVWMYEWDNENVEK